MVIKIQSERPAEPSTQDATTRDFQCQLRACAANMIRITAGAGKPHLVIDEMLSAIQSFQALVQLSDRKDLDLQEIIAAALDVDQIELERREGPEAIGLVRLTEYGVSQVGAVMKVRKAGLRLAAAELMGQTTQIRTNEGELHSGIVAYAGALKAIRQGRGKPVSEQSHSSEQPSPAVVASAPPSP